MLVQQSIQERVVHFIATLYTLPELHTLEIIPFTSRLLIKDYNNILDLVEWEWRHILFSVTEHISFPT